MTDKQQRLQDAIDKLVDQSDVLGAVLVSRDGFCVFNDLNRLPNPETFSAMSATLVGAAEAALSELGVQRATNIIVNTDDEIMIAYGATDELLLIALADGGSAIADLLGRVEETAHAVAKVVTG